MKVRLDRIILGINLIVMTLIFAVVLNILNFEIFYSSVEVNNNSGSYLGYRTVVVKPKIKYLTYQPTNVDSQVLESYTGVMSFYGPDCGGCSGKVAYGYDISNGKIFYNDKTYGQIYILAGDYKYPFGTIVRIKNSKLGTIYGIVLDRGGVGLNKRFQYDLLVKNEATSYQYGVEYNLTFEILRYGF